MNCEHGTYQCTNPVTMQLGPGATELAVVMWCTTCGDAFIRLPRLSGADERALSLRATAPPFPPGMKP